MCKINKIEGYEILISKSFEENLELFKEDGLILSDREKEIAMLFFEYGAIFGKENTKKEIEKMLKEIDTDSVFFAPFAFDIE